MICKNPSYTSGLVEIMKHLMSGKKNQGNCKTQGDPKVSNKRVGNSQWRRCIKWLISIEDLWRK